MTAKMTAAQKEAEERIAMIVDALAEMLSDGTVPRNIKLKLEATINVLKEQTDVSIRANRALNSLEEISDDVNLQAYTRTQLMNIASMLEKV